MTMETICSKTAMTVSHLTCGLCSPPKLYCFGKKMNNLVAGLAFLPKTVFLSCPGPSIQSKIVTNQQMDDIAAKLGAQWKTLASHLEVKAAEMREIETDSEDVDMQAKLLLVAWQDREGTQATVENLVAALNAAGFGQIADGLNEA